MEEKKITNLLTALIIFFLAAGIFLLILSFKRTPTPTAVETSPQEQRETTGEVIEEGTPGEEPLEEGASSEEPTSSPEESGSEETLPPPEGTEF